MSAKSKLAVAALVFGLVLVQVWTCVALVNARHELRRMRGEFASLREDVDEHDGMLEQTGDALDRVERRLS